MQRQLFVEREDDLGVLGAGLVQLDGAGRRLFRRGDVADRAGHGPAEAERRPRLTRVGVGRRQVDREVEEAERDEVLGQRAEERAVHVVLHARLRGVRGVSERGGAGREEAGEEVRLRRDLRRHDGEAGRRAVDFCQQPLPAGIVEGVFDLGAAGVRRIEGGGQQRLARAVAAVAVGEQCSRGVEMAVPVEVDERDVHASDSNSTTGANTVGSG